LEKGCFFHFGLQAKDKRQKKVWERQLPFFYFRREKKTKKQSKKIIMQKIKQLATGQ